MTNPRDYMPFRARPRGGTAVAEVTVPAEYRLEDAARAIALQLPTVPGRFGRKTLHHALTAAAANGYIGSALEKADPEMTTFYRDALIEHEIFPKEGETLSSKAQFRAKPRGTQWVVTVAPSISYTLDEAARAIALETRYLPARFGRNTLPRMLREAARNKRHGKALEKADPDAVELWREKLLEFEIFPAESGE